MSLRAARCCAVLYRARASRRFSLPRGEGYNRRCAPEVSPSATGRDGCTFSVKHDRKRYQKERAKKGYANREGYALIYLDIARLFFFPKRTIRLYFNSRLRRSKKAVCEHCAQARATPSRRAIPLFFFFLGLSAAAPRCQCRRRCALSACRAASI